MTPDRKDICVEFGRALVVQENYDCVSSMAMKFATLVQGIVRDIRTILLDSILLPGVADNVIGIVNMVKNTLLGREAVTLFVFEF